MLSLPKGLSTLQSLSVQPCWQGLPAETLSVPAEGGSEPALPRCSARRHQRSGQKHFLTSAAPLKQRGTPLPDGVCLKRQERRAAPPPAFVSSPSKGGLWGRARDAVPAGVWQIGLLQSVPLGPGAREWSILPGPYGRSREE